MTDSLITLAQESRHAFERKSVDTALLEKLYTHYNPAVEDITHFINKASTLFPVANCGIASLYLCYKLGKGEVVNGTYNKKGHTFVLVEGLVVDITADQFGGPVVYIGPLKEPWALAS